jgi:hypothetical protein
MCRNKLKTGLKVCFSGNICKKRSARGSTPRRKYSQTAAEIGGLSAGYVLPDRV